MCFNLNEVQCRSKGFYKSFLLSQIKKFTSNVFELGVRLQNSSFCVKDLESNLIESSSHVK
jgi:hypothetical protein